MLISARLIKKSRTNHKCCLCKRPIINQKLRLYGAAEEGEKPYVLYVHPSCNNWHHPKIDDALQANPAPNKSFATGKGLK